MEKNANFNSTFVKLPEKQLLILELLVNNGDMFGLEMVEASNNRLALGTVYVTLQRMKEKSYLDSYEVPRPAPETGIARRKYKITAYGEKVYLSNIKATEFYADLVFGEIL